MTQPSLRPVEILLVEDNPGDVALTRRALLRSRVLVTLTVTENGDEALQRLHDGLKAGGLPDLVLLDLNLPGRSGMEVLEEMKSHEVLRRIPVTILTSSRAEEDIARSYDLHANCYITKPVDLSGLQRVVSILNDFWFTVVRLPGQPAGTP